MGIYTFRNFYRESNLSAAILHLWIGSIKFVTMMSKYIITEYQNKWYQFLVCYMEFPKIKLNTLLSINEMFQILAWWSFQNCIWIGFVMVIINMASSFPIFSHALYKLVLSITFINVSNLFFSFFQVLRQMCHGPIALI